MDIREIGNTTLASERRHWWIVTRFHYIDHALRRLVADGGEAVSVIEFGCGTGQNLWYLRRASPFRGFIATVVGVEPSFPENLALEWKLAEDRIVKEQPGDSDFDFLLAADVLEHVEEDAAALAAWTESLKPGGLVLLTVPAFTFLWSGHDDYLEHKRRYTRKQLDRLAASQGLCRVKSAYVFSFIFPLVVLIRKVLRRNARQSGLSRPPPFANRVLKGLGRIEAAFGGCPWFGSSVAGLYRKPAQRR